MVSIADTIGDKEHAPCVAWKGSLGWLTFCVLAVILRGIQWDETLEHAQILAGQVVYPAGHPLYRYVCSAYSLQTYLSTALLRLGSSADWLCGLRNVLTLASAVVPVFLFGSLLTGRALWGHVAAAFALRGVYLSFGGSYPLVMWPGTYSNGPIGGACALLALYGLLAGLPRAGGLLAGLMPALHIGQAPVVMLQYLLDGLNRARRCGVVQTLRVWKWLFVGLAASTALLALTLCLRPHIQPEGGYLSSSPAAPIWSYYTAHYDGHRQPPPTNGHLALAGLLWLGACVWFRKETALNTKAFRGIWLYAGIVAVVVWTTLLLHTWLGPGIPYLLIGWMPYRLINHIPPLLLAVLVAGVVGQRSTVVMATLALLLAYACFPVEWLASVLPSAFVQRYLASGDAIMFVMYGTTAAGMLRGATRNMIGANLVLLAALAFVHHSGAVWVALGAVIALLRAPSRFVSRARLEYLAAGLAVVLASAVLSNQHASRGPALVGRFEQRVTDTLRERSEPQAMLVAGPNEPLLQARTGHPMFVEATTASLMSYVPSLAPTIQRMYDDMYGIRFDAPPPTFPWQTRWAERSPDEWQALGVRYGIRYVVTPEALPLRIPAVFSEDGLTLYAVPR